MKNPTAELVPAGVRLTLYRMERGTLVAHLFTLPADVTSDLAMSALSKAQEWTAYHKEKQTR